MTEPYEESYWSRQFDVTQEDLNDIAERLEGEDAPQELREIALGLLRGHLESDPGDPNEQAEEVLVAYGERILSLLAAALQFDPRFTGLEDKWFLVEKLPRLERESLQKIHRQLLQKPSSSVEEILSVLKEGQGTDPTLRKMALQAALRRLPERFENTGTSAHPQWRARLPGFAQAEVTQYAYDPQTYEILCRPGQRLSEKKAKRLQELELYGQVVTFAE